MLLEIGLGVLALGVLAFVYGVYNKVKAGRIADAPFVTTGDAASRGTAVANAKGGISAEGNVSCPSPLLAPVSGVPCLYYSLTCTATWKEGDVEKTKVVDEQKVAAELAIDDGTGPVRVDLRAGGDFEPTQKKSETKSVGLLGGLKGDDLVFGHYRVSTGLLSMGTTYEVEEEYVPVQPRLYVCGKTDAGTGITAPSWRALLVSNQSRDALLGSATKGAKQFMIGGAVACLLGSISAGVGGAMAGGEGSSKATTKAAVTAPAAAADTAPAAAATAPGSPAAPAKGVSKPAKK